MSLCMAQKYPVFPRALLPDAPGLHLLDVALTAHEVALELAATSTSTPCPVCGQRSSQIHSHYRRSVADLLWAGRTVRLLLLVRTFFCRDVTCPRAGGC
jgi:transposase